MKRLPGDQEVAIGFSVTHDILQKAVVQMREAETVEVMLVIATDALVRADLVLANAVTQLEKVTDVPWAAIAVDNSIGPVVYQSASNRRPAMAICPVCGLSKMVGPTTFDPPPCRGYREDHVSPNPMDSTRKVFDWSTLAPCPWERQR